MKLHIYAYRDSMTNSYTNPFTDLNEPEKMKTLFSRALKGMTEEQKNKFKGKELYCLGNFDDESGIITACKPTFIAGVE